MAAFFVVLTGLLAGRHDRRRRERQIVVDVIEDVGLTHLDLRLEPCQPRSAVADSAASVMVLVVVPKRADPEIRARGQHLWRDIIRCRVELDRLKRGAVGKVLGKRTRIRTGVGRLLTD